MSLAARRVQNPATRRDSSNDDLVFPPYLVRRSGRNKAPKRQLTRQIYDDHLPRKCQAVGKKIKAATGKQQYGHGCYITMRYSPAAVNNTTLIMSLSDMVKEMLKDLGFGSLLIMNIEGLEDRVLGAYLLSSVQDNPLRIKVGGRSMSITAQVVHLVTGLPMGNQ